MNIDFFVSQVSFAPVALCLLAALLTACLGFVLAAFERNEAGRAHVMAYLVSVVCILASAMAFFLTTRAERRALNLDAELATILASDFRVKPSAERQDSVDLTSSADGRFSPKSVTLSRDECRQLIARIGHARPDLSQKIQAIQ